MGIIYALVAVACQWSVGCYLTKRWGLENLSLAGTWVLGLSALTLLNCFFLVIHCGFLIHLNLLALLYLLKSFESFEYSVLKKAWPVLCLAIVMALPNLKSPILDMDAQHIYVSCARQWAETGAFDTEGFHRLFSQRPQSVSVVYSWGLMWGSDAFAQVMDLCFVLAALLWMVERFGLSRLRSLWVLVLLTFFEWRFPFVLHAMAIGGNDFFVGLLTLLCYELLCEKKSHMGAWICVATLFLMSRWTAPFVFGFLLTLYWFFEKEKRKQLWLYLLAPVVLALPWYLWFAMAHGGNPVYPGMVSLFGGEPVNNRYFVMDHVGPDSWLGHAMGIRSFSRSQEFFMQLGPLGIIVALMLLAWIKGMFKKENRLVTYAFVVMAINALVTTQWRFQHASILILLAIFVSCLPSFKKYRVLVMTLNILILCVTLGFHGKAFVARVMTDNRVTHEKSVDWLNENGNEKDMVLWPATAFYHLSVPAIRADEMLWKMTDDVCDDPQKVSWFVKDFGVTYLAIEHFTQVELEMLKARLASADSAGKYFMGSLKTRILLREMIDADPVWEKQNVLGTLEIYKRRK